MIQLAGAGLLEPLRQGDLDGLCGLYAIINAIALVSYPVDVPTTAQVKHLFRVGIAMLDDAGKLGGCVGGGMRRKAWCRLAAQVVAYAGDHLNIGVRVDGAITGADRDALFAVIEQAIGEGKAVLVELRGAYNHYTVVSGIGADRLRLFDSYGYRWIARRSCQHDPSGTLRHYLPAKSVMIVGLASQKKATQLSAAARPTGPRRHALLVRITHRGSIARGVQPQP